MPSKSNARLYCGECGSEHYFTRTDGRMECTDCGKIAIVLEVSGPFFPPHQEQAPPGTGNKPGTLGVSSDVPVTEERR